MAEVQKCLEGHFYDRSRFSSCPHCEGKLMDRQSAMLRKVEITKQAIEYLNRKLERSSSLKDTLSREKSIERKKTESRPVPDPRSISRRMPDGEAAIAASEEELGEMNPSIRITNSRPVNPAAASPGKDYFITGWLICVEGADYGHVHPLYNGYHSIGSEAMNKICIPGDPQIFRNMHCSIFFDVRNNCFYLKPEQNCSTFLRGVRISESQKLQSGDEITIGKTRLVFLAFCEGSRKWAKN